jgi:hypothetical protein
LRDAKREKTSHCVTAAWIYVREETATREGAERRVAMARASFAVGSGVGADGGLG